MNASVETKESAMSGGEIKIAGLTKEFGDARAVDDLSLEIAGGEFFSLPGAPGCGKPPAGRGVAGLEKPTAGSIWLDGQDVAYLAPNKRPVNTVFQSYALFPFLDVADNVAFGLKYRRHSKAEVRRLVGE